MEKIILKDYQENPIHVYIYQPEGEIKGIVQMVHGAAEHMARYGVFAEFLNQHGYLAIGCDMLGHGLSTDNLDYVHFADKDGDILGYESIVLVKEYIEKTYPGIDVFLYGHSMGSFLARKLILDFPDFYKKVILSGTTYVSKGLKLAGSFIISVIRLFKGPRYVSKFVNGLAVDANPAKMRKAGLIGQKDAEWITRDEAVQQYYHNSNMCGQPFSIQANYDLIQWTSFVDNLKNIDMGNKEMPILLAAGSMDPVSNYGKEIKTLYDFMKKLGYENVDMKLYPDCRHEIHNELIKDEVFQDYLDFLDK
ncbi:MAG: alpha/beta hydrolase [Bacilli bacterium]|nr:alpha/beta hydrolase [Bacilli bacterium]MBN2876124.1 alpha/beta hydrolase [Bacilli bacterium]